MSKPIPEGGPRTTGRLSVRWSEEEARTVKRAAAKAGVKAGELVRSSALEAARRILEWSEVEVEPVVPTPPARRPWFPGPDGV